MVLPPKAMSKREWLGVCIIEAMVRVQWRVECVGVYRDGVVGVVGGYRGIGVYQAKIPLRDGCGQK